MKKLLVKGSILVVIFLTAAPIATTSLQACEKTRIVVSDLTASKSAKAVAGVEDLDPIGLPGTLLRIQL